MFFGFELRDYSPQQAMKLSLCSYIFQGCDLGTLLLTPTLSSTKKFKDLAHLLHDLI